MPCIGFMLETLREPLPWTALLLGRLSMRNVSEGLVPAAGVGGGSYGRTRSGRAAWRAGVFSAEPSPFPQTRRSMVFARHLREVGDEFRSRHLNSTDDADRIPFQEDWTKMKVAPLPFVNWREGKSSLEMPKNSCLQFRVTAGLARLSAWMPPWSVSHGNYPLSGGARILGPSSRCRLGESLCLALPLVTRESWQAQQPQRCSQSAARPGARKQELEVIRGTFGLSPS